MTVYHGSNHNFKVLKIKKKFTKESSLNNEGCGIYFSKDKSAASAYGRYLYTIEIDGGVPDFKKLKTCTAYLQNIRIEIIKETGIDICRYMDLNQIADAMRCGERSIERITQEIWLNLDSHEEFYTNTVKYERDRLWLILKQYPKKHLPDVYMFSYPIKDCGIIKRINPETVRIISKTRLS